MFFKVLSFPSSGYSGFHEAFTPLETSAACTGDELLIPFKEARSLIAPSEPSRYKGKVLLMGFTLYSYFTDDLLSTQSLEISDYTDYETITQIINALKIEEISLIIF